MDEGIPVGSTLEKARTINGRDCEVRSQLDVADVSIVVPVYNAASTLDMALASLLAQDYEGTIEIVCVDDASTDDSREIIEGYASRNPNVTIVTHHDNAGYGAAMNDGIAVAHGQWIGILEPDDYVLPNMCSTLMAEAELGDCDIVKSPYIREIREEGVPRGGLPATHLHCNYHHRVHPATDVFTARDPGTEHLFRQHPSIWSALYRKAFLEEKDIAFPEYPGAGWADGEFGYSALLSGRIRYVDEPFYVYREETPAESDAFQRNNKLLPLDRWQKMLDILETLAMTDDHILRAHNAKGFAYAKSQLAAHEEDEEVLVGVNEMFDRMDPALVASDNALDPELKSLFGDRREVNARGNRVLYFLNLGKELAFYAHANGLSDTRDRIKLLMGK